MIDLRLRLAAVAFVCCMLTGHYAVPARADGGRVTLQERIALLQQAYPDLIYSVTHNIMRLMNNRTVVIDDGRNKDYLTQLHNADIEDQLAQIYPIGKCTLGRKVAFDPGHIRSAAFLRLAYGANEYQVKRTTTLVDWFGTQVRFSTRHGAADALRRVRDDLRQLPAKYHNLLKKPARSMQWVNIADTDQLDVHAFAIAIDLNPQFRDYWRRFSRGKKLRTIRYRNRIPPAVVAIFERHGFIWGGKWYRYETTHFEYRPALIAIARLAEQRGCVKDMKGKN
ncbi:MAG: M15 family metallopeptidase [Hyphomicrobiaceae bacterium]